MDLQTVKKELFEQIDKRSRLEKQIILCLFQDDKDNINMIRRKFNEVEYQIMNKKYELEKLIKKAYSEKNQIENRIDYLIEANCTDDLEILIIRLAEICEDLEVL